jgi:glycosyltransferase involved in cell wall biosynthesis
MENNNPKISVIIPTYNRAHLLPRAIKSVLAQSFKDFELIIVDDASTDNSHEIVKNFKEKDKRIKYLKHNKNSGGPPKPKNTGIKISKGKYIAFLDSDDEWFSNKLEKQITLYKKNKNNNVGLVGCGVISINERTKEKRKIEPPTQIEVKSPKILENTIAHSCSSVIIKKTIFENIGLFDENIKVLDDRDLYIRILEKYKFLFTQEPLFHYYIHNDNVTNKKMNVKILKTSN